MESQGKQRGSEYFKSTGVQKQTADEKSVQSDKDVEFYSY